jgi:hypothetical protein
MKFCSDVMLICLGCGLHVALVMIGPRLASTVWCDL